MGVMCRAAGVVQGLTGELIGGEMDKCVGVRDEKSKSLFILHKSDEL